MPKRPHASRLHKTESASSRRAVSTTRHSIRRNFLNIELRAINYRISPIRFKSQVKMAALFEVYIRRDVFCVRWQLLLVSCLVLYYHVAQLGAQIVSSGTRPYLVAFSREYTSTVKFTIVLLSLSVTRLENVYKRMLPACAAYTSCKKHRSRSCCATLL